MRRRSAPLASLLLAVAAIAAACGGSSGGDPYDLLYKAIEADRDPVQVNAGFALTDGTMSIVIDPDQLGFVVDKDEGTGAVHVAIPLSTLNIDPITLLPLGFAGDSFEVDVVLDGDGLYARSPLVGTVLKTLLSQAGEAPAGDLTGWLRLGTAAELASLLELIGGTSTLPSATLPPAGNAGELKSSLEAAGITLKDEGRQNQNGVDANHLSVAIDVEKLLASDYLESADPAAVESIRSGLRELELQVDLWLEASSGQLAEIDVKAGSTTNSAQKAELTLRFRDPDGSIPTDPPADFVEIPLEDLMTLLGGGLFGF